MEALGSKPLRAASCKPATSAGSWQLGGEAGQGLGAGQSTARNTESSAAPRRTQRKRPRPPSAGLCAHDLCLYVRWHSAGGGVRVNRLPLEPISGVHELRGLFRRLIRGAFASPASLPDYLTSEEYYQLTPSEQLISLPDQISRTEFRLVATVEGWEYTVCERTLPMFTPDTQRKLLITLAEFESEPVVVGDRVVAARLLAYPTVCVKREFLDAFVAKLVTEQELVKRCVSPASSATLSAR
ncbi:hypothetical protein ACK3TF_004423 [Chlorella vulgaris]